MNFYKKSQINSEELALKNFFCLLYDITSDIHILSVTEQSCEFLANVFINTCNMTETDIFFI